MDSFSDEASSYSESVMERMIKKYEQFVLEIINICYNLEGYLQCLCGRVTYMFSLNPRTSLFQSAVDLVEMTN